MEKIDTDAKEAIRCQGVDPPQRPPPTLPLALPFECYNAFLSLQELWCQTCSKTNPQVWQKLGAEGGGVYATPRPSLWICHRVLQSNKFKKHSPILCYFLTQSVTIQNNWKKQYALLHIVAQLALINNSQNAYIFITGCFHVPRCLHMCIKMLKELLEEKTLPNSLPNGLANGNGVV